ncbi:RNA polymerase II C-terminal domain phosphatase-like 4 isoform X1 [Typha angustifolia]|uniref:RNA polymerase II C-terminal domain phosphatase-like 4 isoform X1 n=1 Tax=Typha angustifolia TaxID=59011 RepID=UPI003C2FF4AA
MSLAAESPSLSSSSSDDFAAILDAELEFDSSEPFPDDDETNSVEEDDELHEQRNKKRKVEDFESSDELQERVMLEKNLEKTGTSTESEHPTDICPPHPGFFRGLCMRCGQLEEDDGSGVAFGYIHKDLKLGATEMDRLRGADLKKLLREKKLILILDLDHTLLNSTRLVDVSIEEDYLIRQADSTKDDPGRSLFRLDSIHMLTKLRPFIHDFLREASSMFDMYVYTMAERSYALEMVKLLDPGNVYFNSKVISQSDCTQRHQKGLDVVLGAESVAVILDDTEFVWQKHKENLIQMERYHFFSSSCRQFGFSIKSLSESMKDEMESDGALATILNVLKKSHQRFFDPELGIDLSSRDVRQVMKKIRQEILQGCKIVFSRVFPYKSRAEDQSIWKMAEQLGATCSTDVDSSVTHVVAMDSGTEKARWAVQNKKFLVSPSWIEAANYRWNRQKEEDFTISTPRNN